MYIFPIPLDGETPTGFVMRSARLSGLPSMSMASTYFFGRKGLPLLLPGNLALFAQRTHGVAGKSLNMVVEHRTVIPAFVPFLSAEARESIDAHLMGTSTMRSPYTFLGMTTPAGAPKHVHLFCPQCVREGLESHGWPYWRREHQIPFQTMCSMHPDEPLTPGCGACRYSEPGACHLALPRADKCWCGSALRPVKALRTDALRLPHQRYGRLSYDLLQGGLSDVGSPQTIGAAYRHRAKQLGFILNGQVNRRQVFRAFEEHHGSQFLTFHRSTHDAEKSWLSYALKGVVPPSMPKNIMLIDLLFGSVKALTQTVNLLASTSADHEAGTGGHPKRIASITTARLESCKREILKLRKQHPEFTRSEIIQALGRAARDARDNARDWYEEHMPAKLVHRRPQYKECQLRERAEELEGHLLANHEAEMKSDLRPRPISERLLFSGHSLRARVREVRAALPELGTLIDSLLEDKKAFQHRLACWLYDHPELIPLGMDQITFISLRTKLSASVVVRIVDALQYLRSQFLAHPFDGKFGLHGG